MCLRIFELNYEHINEIKILKKYIFLNNVTGVCSLI